MSVAPGQLITLHVYGLSVPTSTTVTATLTGAGYPPILNGISVDLVQGNPAATTSLGIHALYQSVCEPVAACSPLTGITLQIPFELDTNFESDGTPLPVLRLSQNGAVAGTIGGFPVSDAVHVLNTCDDTQVYFSAAYSVPEDTAPRLARSFSSARLFATFRSRRPVFLSHRFDQWDFLFRLRG